MNMPGPNQMDEDTSAQTFGAAIAPVSGTADGTYSANEQQMLTDLQTAVNAIVAVLKQAGLTQQD
jgi:hypothetical protein